MITAGATALAIAAALALPAFGNDVAQTCNDLGFTNLEADSSGAWGSVDFDSSASTLTLTVEEGFEVRLCVKAGSAQQGLGPEVTGWFSEGVHQVGHTSGKDLSHYGVESRPVETTTTEAPTTTVGETTTTEGETTTTQATTTTIVETTTTEGETTTTGETSTTEEQPASWSATGACEGDQAVLTVVFGEGIRAVAVFHDDPAGLPVAIIHESGELTTALPVGMRFTLSALGEPGFRPSPHNIVLDFGEGCETAPTLTVPGTPADPGDPAETLPFTGATEDAGLLATIGGVLGLLGVGLLALKGRFE